jgi:hypothetical protein
MDTCARIVATTIGTAAETKDSRYGTGTPTYKMAKRGAPSVIASLLFERRQYGDLVRGCCHQPPGCYAPSMSVLVGCSIVLKMD